MATVVIDGTNFTAYSSLEDADEYLLASIGDVGDAWREESDDDVKGRALVSATRNLDRLSWTTGYTSDTGWQAAIITATIEYAAYLLEGSFTSQLATMASGVKRQKAGTAEQEFFRPVVVVTAAGPSVTLPRPVFDLIKAWLAGSNAGITLATSSGTAYPSAFETGYGVHLL